MATRYWLGVSNDLTAIANWSATEGGAGGATVPGAGDSAWFTRNSTMPALNMTGIAGLTNLYIEQGFGEGAAGRDFGTQANPFVCNVSGVFQVRNRSLRSLYTGGTIASFFGAEIGSCALFFQSGEVTSCQLPDTGSFEFAVDVKCTTFVSGGCSGVLKECPTSPADLVLRVGGGVVEVQRKTKTILSQGLVRLTETAHTNVSGSSIDIMAGGRVMLEHRGGQIGNASTELVSVFNGGTLVARPLVPFALTSVVKRHAGSVVRIPANATTSAPVYSDLGGAMF